jgi:hypothetical protein
MAPSLDDEGLLQVAVAQGDLLLAEEVGDAGVELQAGGE